MFEVFMYPVSGIMKFWHWLIGSFVDESTAWLVSIILLVITVRGIVSPLNWMALRSGRISVLMRPESTRINEQMNHAETTEEMAELIQKQQDLSKSYNYKPAAGCIPPLITIPAFLGLYQVILRMSNIEQGSSTVGMLDAADVAAFRETTYSGVPITDFAHDHGDLLNPIVFAAIAFTLANSIISVVRSFLTTQFDQKVNRRIFIIIGILLIVAPILLWYLAHSGPLPVAIILYWGWAYLFTLVQTIVFEIMLHKRYPLTEEVHEMRRESIRAWCQKDKKPALSKEEKKRVNRLRVEARKYLRSNNQQEGPTASE
ncbi:membrane protein insertase YidC [uncultured Corynebacterium sp.]|uniref:membrane protein insertase YidC n=1 Tax=uncultured Corynebacterium sp. TaxID=159447 RepID=UPI00259306A3|nr:membrane protein insertase YidC [uncultured Corynebacterium sp.]